MPRTNTTATVVPTTEEIAASLAVANANTANVAIITSRMQARKALADLAQNMALPVEHRNALLRRIERFDAENERADKAAKAAYEREEAIRLDAEADAIARQNGVAIPSLKVETVKPLTFKSYAPFDVFRVLPNGREENHGLYASKDEALAQFPTRPYLNRPSFVGQTFYVRDRTTATVVATITSGQN